MNVLTVELSGDVLDVEVKARATRVYLAGERRTNVLLLVPPSFDVKKGGRVERLPVRATVERTRDGMPTPFITYFAAKGWPERARSAGPVE